MKSGTDLPAMPLRRARTIIMLCGIVVLICYMALDHRSNPQAELEAAEAALIDSFSADTVERFAEAHVAAGLYDKSIHWFTTLLSQDHPDPRIVGRVSEVFDEWYSDESRSEIATSRTRLRVANTALGELSKYPGNREEWFPRRHRAG